MLRQQETHQKSFEKKEKNGSYTRPKLIHQRFERLIAQVRNF